MALLAPHERMGLAPGRSALEPNLCPGPASGRRSGRAYQTPVAARRVADGFIISLAFGAQVDWHRNLEAAGGGVIRWRGRDYEVSGPEMIDADEALPAFDPVQRLFLRLAGIDGYIRVCDAAVVTR